MKEPLIQLICMELMILIVIIMFIPFFMAYHMSQCQVHVCRVFLNLIFVQENFYRKKSKFFSIEIIVENHTNSTGICFM
jgi:hypothetical protein